jgi:hypothetical protein
MTKLLCPKLVESAPKGQRSLRRCTQDPGAESDAAIVRPRHAETLRSDTTGVPAAPVMVPGCALIAISNYGGDGP